ncbi:MAG: hypothetical protein PHG43_09305, partial [Phenylobacterium sp.]|nr:hypothetical protein [Phenylobacterium sp.]
QKIGAGVVRIVGDASEMNRVQAGDILVTDMTDPMSTSRPTWTSATCCGVACRPASTAPGC